ncbi:MAG: DUF1638 domain-containing protein [Minwuia sp.]|nr:DUF1638 domain-containing protein [Minwuia sp.]
MPDTTPARRSLTSALPDLGELAQDRTLIIACGALAREIGTVIGRNGLSHLALRCLPATLHNTPDKIPEAVRAAIHASREKYGRIIVGYADCGTGGLLDKVCAEEGVERIPGPHCYAFYTGNAAFEAAGDDDMTSFYLTDFLVRQFDTLVIRTLGLDRHPELRDMYFGNYEKVIYLAQTENAELTVAAEQAAEKLGLAFERRFVGLGDLARFINDVN